MSDSTSTTSPISEFPSASDDLTADQLTDGLDLGFDGAEDILRSWRKGMRPDPDLTVSEWAEYSRSDIPSMLPITVPKTLNLIVI